MCYRLVFLLVIIFAGCGFGGGHLDDAFVFFNKCTLKTEKEIIAECICAGRDGVAAEYISLMTLSSNPESTRYLNNPPLNKRVSKVELVNSHGAIVFLEFGDSQWCIDRFVSK